MPAPKEWDTYLPWEEVVNRSVGRAPWYISWFKPEHRVLGPKDRLWFYQMWGNSVVNLHHKYSTAVCVMGSHECVQYDAGHTPFSQ